MKLGSIGGVLAALAGASFVVSCGDDGATTCGNGKIDPGEQCDAGAKNGPTGPCTSDCKTPPKVSIEGDVMPFFSEVEGARVAGATISIVERPDLTTTSDANGHFAFDGLDAGSKATLVFQHPDYKPTQTATLTLGPNGVDPFTIQPVSNSLFTALSGVIKTPLDEANTCIVATTVSRIGGSLYVELRQGEPDATVTLTPAVPAESGPIYFNESVIPTPGQPATSIDGGAVFINVPPGTYVLSGSKAGHAFAPIEIDCRAGMIVNGGPPLGVQADVVSPDPGGGAAYVADAYSASTDALCAATASCVNAKAGMVTYPPSLVTSCQSMFRNMWAEIDPACDGAASLRDKGRALYDCRASDCANTLGDDTVCTAEESDWDAARQAYGACFAAKHP